MTEGPLTQAEGGVYLDVWAQPRASKTRVAGLHDGALKVQLAAPPVDGEANEALTRFVAKLFGVPKTSVELVSGQSSRKKRLFIKYVTPEAAAALINPLS